MVLKMFSKGNTAEAETAHEVETNSDNQQRIEKLESNLNELGGEVVRLRQEVNTLLARQHTFKMALRRLREYLEERSGQQESDETAEEVGASFQDVSHESEEDGHAESGESQARAKPQSKLH